MDRAKALPNTVPGDGFDVAVEALTRDQLRSRRAREVRKHTISMKRLAKRELDAGAMLYPEAIEGRPVTRGECEEVQRPCPYVSCRYNLYLDINQASGAVILNFPDLEPDEMIESCALDLAELGEQRLEDVGAAMNITRERVRQIQEKAEERLLKRRQLADFEGHESSPLRGEK